MIDLSAMAEKNNITSYFKYFTGFLKINRELKLEGSRDRIKDAV